MSKTLNSIKSDYHRWYGHGKRDRLLMPIRFFTLDRLNYCLWLRIGNTLYGKRGIWKIPYAIVRIIHTHNKHRLGIQIKLGTEVGDGIRFPHYGGIVLAKSKIGINCTIHQNVTIGRSFGKNDGCPTIGDNVIIFANATLIGDIKIGNNVIIGANSVVLTDIPDNSVVAGNPAKIISNDVEKCVGEKWKPYFYGY